MEALLAWLNETRGRRAMLARELKSTPVAVHHWEHKLGRVPASRVVEVERITGIPRAELRPDLYAERQP